MKKRRLTPRRRQIIFRKIMLGFSLVFAGAVLALFVSGIFTKTKAADNYNKYYKYVVIQSGDTLYDYSQIYGKECIESQDYIKEVCMINNISANDIVAGDEIVIPYYKLNIQ